MDALCLGFVIFNRSLGFLGLDGNCLLNDLLLWLGRCSDLYERDNDDRVLFQAIFLGRRIVFIDIVNSYSIRLADRVQSLFLKHDV